MSATQSLPHQSEWRVLRQPKQHNTFLNNYPPLCRDPVHIRLVRILPSRSWRDSELRCELRDIQLTPDAKYWALSYEWGPVDKGYDLLVATHLGTLVLRIRKNLRDFLRRIRNESDFQGRWLWIDQICINQQSNDEKSQQVRHMRSIYNMAARTIIWIHSAPLKMALGRRNRKIYFNRPALPTKRDGLYAIMESSYWRRVWIVQEVLLSWDICFMGPTFTVDTSFVSSRKLYLWYCKHKRVRAFTGVMRAWKRCGLTGEEHSSMPQQSALTGLISWDTALHFSAASVASIPADRVYALLGLMQPQLRINPDYTASRPNILIRVMIVEIVHGSDPYVKGNTSRENDYWRLVMVWDRLVDALNLKEFVGTLLVQSCLVLGLWLREQDPSNRQVLNESALDSFVRVCGDVASATQESSTKIPLSIIQPAKHLNQSWYPFQWLCQELGILLDNRMIARLKSFKELGTREESSHFEALNTVGSPLREMLETVIYQTEGLAPAVSRLEADQGLQKSSTESSPSEKPIAEGEASAG